MPPELWVLREQKIKRADPLVQTFRVVDPVDAEEKFDPKQTRAQSLNIRISRCALRAVGKFLHVDADWKSCNAASAEAAANHRSRARNSKLLPYEFGEIRPVGISLEPDEVVRQHGLDQFAVLGQCAERAGARPWRMKKKPERTHYSKPAQLGAKRKEMVVMHPDARFRSAESRDHAGHISVHCPVRCIVLGAWARKIEARMEQRP
jgi:hypothetical protein